jgi:orotate phosphoribosyltransferase-like protein
MRGGARPGSGRKPANFDHKRAIKLKEDGLSSEQIAARFGVSVYAIKWFFRKQREKATYAQNQGNTQG